MDYCTAYVRFWGYSGHSQIDISQCCPARCHSSVLFGPEGFAAALSSRPGRAAKAEPVGYDLGRLCDRRCNGNGIPNGKGGIINFAADEIS